LLNKNKCVSIKTRSGNVTDNDSVREELKNYFQERGLKNEKI